MLVCLTSADVVGGVACESTKSFWRAAGYVIEALPLTPQDSCQVSPLQMPGLTGAAPPHHFLQRRPYPAQSSRACRVQFSKCASPLTARDTLCMAARFLALWHHVWYQAGSVGRLPGSSHESLPITRLRCHWACTSAHITVGLHTCPSSSLSLTRKPALLPSSGSSSPLPSSSSSSGSLLGPLTSV